jgi:glyoxylase-like metal-dependent hydrolase (beta-lactamase superfamily II)
MPDIEVTPLELARLELPEFHPEAPGIDTIYGFLVRDAENCVLVDTGVGSGSDLIDRLYKPVRADLSAVLLDVGVSVAEITAIVNSHLHFDHCGNNSLFPDVPIFVQEAELKAAQEANYTVPEWVSFPGANYEPVSGSRSISASLELQPTPGHTPGHQSLVVGSGKHLEVVVGQASYTAAEFQLFASRANENPAQVHAEAQEYLRSNATWSEEAYLASVASLHRLRPSRAYFSHDPIVWARAV